MKPDEETRGETRNRRLPTTEELRWRAAAHDPAKARAALKYQYILLAIWVLLLIGWIFDLVWDHAREWWQFVALLFCGLAVILGIINNKRIIKGQKLWGDF